MELRECPFCGGEAHIDSDYSSESDHTFWQVWHDCDTNPGPIRHTYGHALSLQISTPWCTSDEAAIELWNRRAERTCRMVSAFDTDELEQEQESISFSPEDTLAYRCEGCGFDFRYERGLYPSYCPSCGAKVVVE